MAAYSRWQNDNLYRICDEIRQAERERDRNLFFRVDTPHVEPHLSGQSFDTDLPRWHHAGAYTARPDGVPDWDKLKATRLMQDDILSAGGRDWTEAWLAEEIVMRSPRLDDPPTFPRWVMVAQLYNHQTHHRSQVTGALHAMGIDYGATHIPWRPGAGYFAD